VHCTEPSPCKIYWNFVKCALEICLVAFVDTLAELLVELAYYDLLSPLIRSTSESRPNSIEGKNVRPPVRPYVRPSTKSFFNLNEILYIGRGR